MKGKVVKGVSGDKELFEKYKTRGVIGVGNSVVYQVEDDYGRKECVKEVRLKDTRSELVFRKEVQLLQRLRDEPHECIVEYRGSYTLTEHRGQFNIQKKGYIQMEKGMTNLQSFIMARKVCFVEDDVLRLLIALTGVFAHLQRCGVAHRDIKPSNVLVFCEQPLRVKVCDIGAGTAVDHCTREMTVIGTSYYLSPQLYRAHQQKLTLISYKAYKSDAYSLGLLLLEFATLARLPSRLNSFNSQPQCISQQITAVKQAYPNIIGLGKVLRRLLQEDVNKRSDFLQLQKYIQQQGLLRSKIDSSITLDPQLTTTIRLTNQIKLQSLQSLTQLQQLVSTGAQFQKLNISLQPPYQASKRHFFQDLINLKYLSLTHLHLSLQMAALADQTILSLADALLKQTNLRTLVLQFWNNAMTTHGLQQLLTSISLLPLLHSLTLNVSHNKVKITLPLTLDFSALSTLDSLQLNIGFNDISSDALPALMRQIAGSKGPSKEQRSQRSQKSIKEGAQLRVLDLQLESIRAVPLHLRRAFKELTALDKLQELTVVLSCNSLRDEGVYGVAQLCEGLPQLLSLRLLLRNCEVTDKGWGQLVKALQQLHQLKEIKINLMQNEITEGSLKQFTLEGCSKLQSLDLNLSNNKLSDLGFKHLSNAMKGSSLMRLRLVIDGCALTEKGSLYLGRMVSEQPLLQELELSLRENQVQLKGIQYICAGMLKAAALRKLKLVLERTMIGDYCANYLASCLLKMGGLKSVDLNLEGCNLSSATMSNIVETVKQYSDKANDITVSMMRNQEVKMDLYRQIKDNLQYSRAAVKIDPVNAFLT